MYFDNEYDTYITEYIYGNAEVEFDREMEHYSNIEVSEVELGVLEYNYIPVSIEKMDYTIISGQISDEALFNASVSLELDSQNSALEWDSLFIYADINMLNGENNSSIAVSKKLYANPLRRETEIKGTNSFTYVVYAEYNDRGAITYYKKTIDDAIYEYRYIYS